MLYTHQYFKLNTDTRKVFDENGKELRLKGNAFLFLEFLCEKFPKGVTITDINDNFIAPVKSKRGEYSEDYIRNLRNVITRAISRDVIEYKNAVYSIVGEIKKTEAILSVEPAKSFLSKFFRNKASKIVLVFLLCIVVILLLAYGYYFINYKDRSATASKVGNDMVLIPAGNFLMGSTEQEIQSAYNICLADEGASCNKQDFFSQYPQSQVFLPAFYIDKEEVSNSDYKIFIDATKRQAPHFWNDTNLNNPVHACLIFFNSV